MLLQLFFLTFLSVKRWKRRNKDMQGTETISADSIKMARSRRGFWVRPTSEVPAGTSCDKGRPRLIVDRAHLVLQG